MGLDQLMPFGIGYADNGGLADGFVFDQRAFDFERTDPVIRGLDDIVGTADKPPVAVGVERCPVAGVVVAVSEDAGHLFRIADIFGEKTDAAPVGKPDGDMAGLVGLEISLPSSSSRTTSYM